MKIFEGLSLGFDVEAQRAELSLRAAGFRMADDPAGADPRSHSAIVTSCLPRWMAPNGVHYLRQWSGQFHHMFAQRFVLGITPQAGD
jgi:hypothetical protein